jgi:CHAT domain
MERDYTAFIDYTPQAPDEISDLDRFLTRTTDPGERFALLYVAAHGEYSPKWVCLRLASRSILDWQGKLGALKENSGLVFLNACHTGESVADERLKDGLLRGFAQMFLLEGAQGVLATLGEVKDEHAREVAGRVVAALADAHGAEVSVVLRKLRAQVEAGGLCRRVRHVPFLRRRRAAAAQLRRNDGRGKTCHDRAAAGVDALAQ